MNLKEYWNKYKFQISGLIALTIPSFILGFMQEWGIGFGLLIATLVFDLWLKYIKKQITITKYARDLLPSWADKLVMVGLFLLVLRFGTGVDGWGAAYWFTEGIINGHISWAD